MLPDACPESFSVTYCGGYSREVPPLPIPNREVKLTGADGTAPPGGRVGSCRSLRVPRSKHSAGESFLYTPPLTRTAEYRHRGPPAAYRMPRRAGDGNDAQGTPGPQQTPPGGMSSEMSGAQGHGNVPSEPGRQGIRQGRRENLVYLKQKNYEILYFIEVLFGFSCVIVLR